MSKQEAQRYRTAIHEAGHAVVAFAHGVRVKLVTIRPDDENGRLGFCELDGPDWADFVRTLHDQGPDPFTHPAEAAAWAVRYVCLRERAINLLESQLQILHGGQIAEILYAKTKPTKKYAKAHWSPDNNKIVDIALRFRGPGCSEWVAEMDKQTTKLLSRPKYRKALFCLANALLQKEELTGRQAKMIYNAAIKPKRAKVKAT